VVWATLGGMAALAAALVLGRSRARQDQATA
jgi:hypothetical protein